MAVLGLDPSLAQFGVAVVDCDRMTLLYSGIVKTHPKMPRSERLHVIRSSIAAMVEEWSAAVAVDSVAVEGGFLGRGAQVSLGIAEARGAALSIDFGVPVTYLSPSTAKMRVTGSGRASKEEVLRAVMSVLSCQLITEDEADAAAVALASSGYDIRGGRSERVGLKQQQESAIKKMRSR